MIFSRAPGRSSRVASQLDAAMLECGMQKHPGKDVDDVTSGTCVGVDLCDGTEWRAPPSAVWPILLAVLAVAQGGHASPGAVRGLLGSMQWFDLLERGKLSMYDNVYEFCRRTPEWFVVALPSNVVNELLCGCVQGMFWRFDMQRPFDCRIIATDASTAFGLGGCYAKAPATFVQSLARADTKGGDHVVLSGPMPDADGRIYAGRAHEAPLQQSDFKVFLRHRLHDNAHINVKEGRAFLASLRWFLRTEANQDKRVTFLVDSKVWIGAVSKGRSSSYDLNRLLRQVAALCMVGGITLHVVFIPTKWNPADAPSRGVYTAVQRPPACKSSPSVSRFAKKLDALKSALARMQATGMFSDSSSDDDS